LLARDNSATLVTLDHHFDKIKDILAHRSPKDIIKYKKPEELI